MKNPHNLLQRARAKLTTGARAVRAWWRRHLRRVADDGDYADAILVLALALANVATDQHRTRRMVHEVTAVYVAVVRALCREGRS